MISARFPIVAGVVLVEPNHIGRQPSRATVAREEYLWQFARPVTPVDTLTIGIVTHRWREVAAVPGTHLNVIRELVEVTTTATTLTAESQSCRQP